MCSHSINEYQQPDISYVKSSTEAIGKYSSAEMLVILEIQPIQVLYKN